MLWHNRFLCRANGDGSPATTSTGEMRLAQHYEKKDQVHVYWIAVVPRLGWPQPGRPWQGGSQEDAGLHRLRLMQIATRGLHILRCISQENISCDVFLKKKLLLAAVAARTEGVSGCGASGEKKGEKN